MLETVLANVAALHRLYLVAKPFHLVYSGQIRAQSLLSGVALSYHAAVGGGAFP
jgi:hypothetical protein